MSTFRKNLAAVGVGLALVAGPMAAVAAHESTAPKFTQTVAQPASAEENPGPVVIDSIRVTNAESTSADDAPRSPLAEEVADAHDLDVFYTDNERNCGPLGSPAPYDFLVGTCWRPATPDMVYVSPAAQSAWTFDAEDAVRDAVLAAVAHRDMYEACGTIQDTEVAEAYAAMFLGAGYEVPGYAARAAVQTLEGRCEQ